MGRAAAERGCLRVLGAEPPAAAAPAAAAAAVPARPLAAPRTVRLLLLPSPPGASLLAEIPSLLGLCPRESADEPPRPSWLGEGGVLLRPGRAREVSLASELGGCQAPGTWATVSGCSWGVPRGALSGARVTL